MIRNYATNKFILSVCPKSRWIALGPLFSDLVQNVIRKSNTLHVLHSDIGIQLNRPTF